MTRRSFPTSSPKANVPPRPTATTGGGLANWLLVHDWGIWFRLEDIQGYNPLQLQRYVDYIDALNGHRQEYHERDLFPAGLTSPLLDLLNLRYLIVPADAAGARRSGAAAGRAAHGLHG